MLAEGATTVGPEIKMSLSATKKLKIWINACALRVYSDIHSLTNKRNTFSSFVYA